MSIEGQVEWQDDEVALVRVDGVARHARFPRGLYGGEAFQFVPTRQIRHVILHHSAGARREGPEAVDRIADYAIASPTYDSEGKVIGGGKGWPGVPYQIVIPGSPTIRGNKVVAYRVWEDDWWTWHTGPAWNRYGLGICVTGWYQSRHDLLAPAAVPAPDPLVMKAAEQIARYLLGKHQLSAPEGLLSHAECGKPACPGDALENLVRRMRGEPEIVLPGAGKQDPRPLKTVEQIQTALVALGYDPGKADGVMGPRTTGALRLFQAAARLKVDGVFGPITERAMRLALAQRST